MAVYFFDSSAIIKRYVREIGTSWVIGLSDPKTGNRIYVASITGVEVTSAIARQGRGGNLSAADKASAMAQFERDFNNEYRTIEIVSSLIKRAMLLAATYALRGYDAVQLAAAVEVHARRHSMRLPALILVSADTALNAAALAEGLLIEDPNSHV